MEYCSNCGKKDKNMYGPNADLCKACYIILAKALDPQIIKEDLEINIKKGGDTQWKE